MTRYLLAHDIGTSGNKATLFTTDGELVKSQVFSYQTRFFHGTWAEQNPQDWWNAVCLTSRAILQGIDPRQIAAISFSGQMMGCVLVDKNGVPVRDAIIWADQRAVEETDFIRQQMDEGRFYQITGHQLSPNYSVEKLMWVRQHEPEVYQQAYKVLNAKDYIIYQLTGKFLTEYSDASGTHLLDLRKLEWSEEILKAAQMDERLLPGVVASTHVAGGVTKAASEATGLAQGTPVVMGGGDGLCAGVGASCVKEGMAYTYVGSSSWISLCTKAPVFDTEQRTFNWPHIVPGKYSPCGTMQAAGGSFAWMQRELAKFETLAAQESDENPYDRINALIESSPVGANGLIFLPYLLGERTPWWNADARGAYVGLKMEHTRADIFRATLEGITMNLGLICDIFKDYADIDEMVTIGGGAQSSIWCQMMADIYEMPVLQPSLLEEATSMGAAVTGGVGVGVYPDFGVVDQFLKIEDRLTPNSAHTQVYRNNQKALVAAYQGLRDVFGFLADA